jgi:hypothetical protein
MHLVTPAPGTFTPQELERLAVYRAAVEAGFYTDEVLLPDAPSTDVTVEPPRDPGVTPEAPGR